MPMTANDKLIYAQCADDHLCEAYRSLLAAANYLEALGDKQLAVQVRTNVALVRGCISALSGRREL